MRIAAAALLMLPLIAGARTRAQDRAPSPATVDVDRLPLDLDRIQRELHASATREERDGLNLRYFIDVYGQAPPLVLFGPDDDLTIGPVPGPPTQREMLEQMTPKEYRAPAADFGAFLRWLADRGNEKKQ